MDSFIAKFLLGVVIVLYFVFVRMLFVAVRPGRYAVEGVETAPRKTDMTGIANPSQPGGTAL